MTETEHNADFIKKERMRIVKLINEINAIVTIQNLAKDGRKYDIDFNNEMSGNYISIRIGERDDADCNLVEIADYWGLARILNPSYFHFNKSELQKNVTIALKEIRKLKTLAKKYADMNCS